MGHSPGNLSQTATGSAGEMQLMVTATKNCSAGGMPSCQPGAGLPPSQDRPRVSPPGFPSWKGPPRPFPAGPTPGMPIKVQFGADLGSLKRV